MRPKSVILLVLALGCGLIAAIGINQVLANRNSGKQDGPTNRILVVMAEINPGEEIMAASVKLEDWPEDKIPEGAVTKLEDIDGRRARTWLYIGEPILDIKLTGKDTTAAEGMIPPGFRVVAVKVDDTSSVAGILRPGNRVDVLVYLMKNPSRGIQRTVTKTLLQNIRVFAVNDRFHMDREERQDTAGINARTVSLLVTPEQAQQIHLASELGKIRFIMRSHDDELATETGDSSANNLFGPSGNSTRESLMTDVKPANVGILGMLNEQPPAVDSSGPDFTMVLIEGDTVRNVAFRNGRPLIEGVLTNDAYRADDSDSADPAPEEGKKDKDSKPDDSDADNSDD